MNINTYVYFAAFAKVGNVTKAAEKLNISQQALSAQISRLEQEYGARLYERSPSFKLTPVGEKVLEYCKILTDWNARLNADIEEMKKADSGVITVGASSKRSFQVMPVVLPAFHREYPNVEIRIVEGHRAELQQNLVDEVTDLCFAASQFNLPNVRCIDIANESSRLYISDELLRTNCAPYYDYLIKYENEPVSIRMFRNCPFILGAPGSRLRMACEAMFHNAGLVPKIVFSSPDSTCFTTLAQASVGATFVNNTILKSFSEGLHIFQIQEYTEVDCLRIYYLNNRYLPAYTRRFIELSIKTIKECFSDPNH